MSNPANDITGILAIIPVIGLLMFICHQRKEARAKEAMGAESVVEETKPARLTRIQPAVAIEHRREIVLTVTEKGRAHV